MASEVMRRHVCDACGKVVEAPVEEVETLMPEERSLPDGWLTVTIVVRGVSKTADCHSRACASAWVAKRERRRKPAENAAL